MSTLNDLMSRISSVDEYLAFVRAVDWSPQQILPDGVTIERREVAGVPVEWLAPTDGARNSKLLVLYMHGGGYVHQSASVARRVGGRLVQITGAQVLCPEYPLAPDHPFPAAHEAVLDIYRSIITEHGFAPESVVVGGDSAGASLALSLMCDARDVGLALPAGAFLNSPAADMALNTPSLDDPIRTQHRIPRRVMEWNAAALLSSGEVVPMDPRHSPVYRDLRGLPPLLVQAAGYDVCHDDAVRISASARTAGTRVTHTEYPEAEHVWIMGGPTAVAKGRTYVDVANEPALITDALREIADFIGDVGSSSLPGREHHDASEAQ